MTRPEPVRLDELPVIGDTELRDLTIAWLVAAGHTGDFPYTIDRIEDVDDLLGTLCNAIPAGYTHAVRHLSVWPVADEADALITLDLPNGLRLASLCVTVRPFQPAEAETGTAAAVEAALGELLFQGQMLAEEHERAVQAALLHRPIGLRVAFGAGLGAVLGAGLRVFRRLWSLR